jgi:hypothetical protein
MVATPRSLPPFLFSPIYNRNYNLLLTNWKSGDGNTVNITFSEVLVLKSLGERTAWQIPRKKMSIVNIAIKRPRASKYRIFIHKLKKDSSLLVYESMLLIIITDC